jgi:hypothetical protein
MKSLLPVTCLLIVGALGCGSARTADANATPPQSTPQDTQNTMNETPSGAGTSTSAAPEQTEPPTK